jgi:ketosteroid isomerase-like protein
MATGDRPGTSDAATADLLALEKEFAEALVKGDADALDGLVSEDWIIIGPEGKVISRTAFLDVVKSGSLTHSTMDFDETRVRLYGDTAIITARAVTTGAYQGQSFSTRERSTDVFVRQQGQWKCVLTQLTAIAEQHG